MKRAQKDVPIFNVWTLIVQSLNIKNTVRFTDYTNWVPPIISDE